MAEKAAVLGSRSQRRGSRALLLGVVLVLGAIFGVAGLISASTAPPPERLRALFTDAVRGIGDAHAAVNGAATLVLFPQPHVVLSEVEVSDAGAGVTLQAREVRVRLKILPLLWNALDVASITIEAPTLRIDYDRQAAPAARSGDAGRSGAFGRVHVADGKLLMRRRGHPDIQLDAVAGTLDWRSPRASALVALTFDVSGQRETLDGWVAAPAAILSGGSSAVRVRAAGPVFDLALDGTIDGAGTTPFEGQAAARAPEFTILLRALGLGAPELPDLGAAAFSADVAATRTGAMLTGSHIHVAGNDFEGSLAVETGPARPAVAGTLAVANLDLGPLIATFPPLHNRAGQWSDAALDAGGLDLLDVDLRISTTRTHVLRTDIANAALSLIVRNRALDLTLADGLIDDGAAKGRVTLVARDDTLDAQATGSFAGADLADLLGADRAAGLAGRLAGTFSLTGRGRTFAQLVAGARGRCDFTLAAGRLGGIDFEQNLRRVDRTDTPGRLRFGGSTSFDLARFDLDVSDGMARLDKGAITGPGANILLSGAIDVPAQALDIAGSATRAATDGAVLANGPHLDFKLAGPWRAPVFEATSTPASLPADSKAP